MSNFKILLHRICNSTCVKSQEKMITKLTGVGVKGGGVWMNACVRFVTDKLATLKTIGMQCNVIAAHRARRSAQILSLYRRLYGEKTPSEFFKKLGELLHRNPNGRMFFLLGAAFFDWKENQVTDKDVLRVQNELKAFFDTNSTETTVHDQDGEDWERLIDEPHFKVWRCPVKGSSLYKYKIFGSYKDIPPSAFLTIQLDLEYRKAWDNHVIKLEKVEEDPVTGSEVIYWATHFPLGWLYNRDYVYVRRVNIDKQKNLMTLVAKSVDHPSFPKTDDYVRVGTYVSQMVIRPHTTFDANGLDYVMSYYDDPQLYVPSWTINKLTVKSLPAFLDQLHIAAKQLVQKTSKRLADNETSLHSHIMNVDSRYTNVSSGDEKQKQHA